MKSFSSKYGQEVPADNPEIPADFWDAAYQYLEEAAQEALSEGLSSSGYKVILAEERPYFLVFTAFADGDFDLSPMQMLDPNAPEEWGIEGPDMSQALDFTLEAMEMSLADIFEEYGIDANVFHGLRELHREVYDVGFGVIYGVFVPSIE